MGVMGVMGAMGAMGAMRFDLIASVTCLVGLRPVAAQRSGVVLSYPTFRTHRLTVTITTAHARHKKGR